ncbi:hypothetical protein DFQ27_004155 [Actinomortierella ambigua]|uniref:Prolyl endopeptidase n=1 Tax=Actinomortierella ambigua TaxID=1343610 RepID=A0A9P6Q6S9_9FUNG|nr:hypothetical protein DFQ27_004155 [Actinomortierella ambigua]
MVNAATPITSRNGKILYPAIRRTDFSEPLHGVQVADPYRWLEEPASKETEAFVEAQNVLSHDYINKFEARGKFNDRLTELFDFERFTTPYRRGDHYYFYHNTGLQAQNVLYQQDTLDSEPRVFLDPNTLEADGTAALSSTRFSHSGNLFAYSIAKAGSDWVTIYLMDSKGNKLSDVVEWAKFTIISFTHDEKGFFYSSYPKPDVEDGKAGTETNINLNKMLYYHRIGTPQSEDLLLYVDYENPTFSPSADTTHDGKYILLSISKDCDPINKLYLIDLAKANHNVTKDLEIIKVVDNFDAGYEYLSNDNTVFYFKTNKDAPRYKVVKYDLNKPEAGFVDIVPEVEDVLAEALIVNDKHLLVQYMHDVKDVLFVHDLTTGARMGQVPVPIGTIGSISGRREDKEFFLSFTSFLSPGTIFRYDFTEEKEENRLTTFKESKVKNFDASLFETDQVFYESKDGTKIPMFITHKKNVALNGNNPTFLYGYGGFTIPIKAGYSPSAIAFIQHFDGVVAYANLRGGGEYGDEWHKAGMKLKKQNVFDDFQWAAKYLIKHKYTQPSRLSINGGSNGGLLVGACLNQAPELFGAAVADVGVLDMLRFQCFTIGHAWCSDYGNAHDNEEEFKYLYKYSPYHNVTTTHPYPPTLITTSNYDDRVVPLHSYKFTAEIQHTAGPLTDSPLLLRVDTRAGHGAGKPIKKRIEEVTDKFSFIAVALGAKWVD